MRIQDMQVGKYYRFRSHPDYSYAKVIEVLKGGQKGQWGKTANPFSYGVVLCEHTVHKNSNMGFKRMFRPCDLVKDLGENYD